MAKMKIDYSAMSKTVLDMAMAEELVPENAYQELVEFYSDVAGLNLKDPTVQRTLQAIAVELALFSRSARAHDQFTGKVVAKIATSLALVAARAEAEVNITEGAEALLGSEQ